MATWRNAKWDLRIWATSVPFTIDALHRRHISPPVIAFCGGVFGIASSGGDPYLEVTPIMSALVESTICDCRAATFSKVISMSLSRTAFTVGTSCAARPMDCGWREKPQPLCPGNGWTYPADHLHQPHRAPTRATRIRYILLGSRKSGSSCVGMVSWRDTAFLGAWLRSRRRMFLSERLLRIEARCRCGVGLSCH